MVDLKEQLNALKALVKKKEKKEVVVKEQDKSSSAGLKETEIEAEKEKLRQAFKKEPEIKGTSFFQRRQESKQTFSKSLSKSSPSDIPKSLSKNSPSDETEKGKFAFAKETQANPEKSGLFAGSSLSESKPEKTLQPGKKDSLFQGSSLPAQQPEKEFSQTPEEDLTENPKSGFSGIYYFFEDGYYGLMDKINSKIPVYKVIDPIDKIVPSFILFSIIILLLISLGVYFVFFNAPPEQKASLLLTLIKEDSTEKLSEYEIIALIDSNQTILKTNPKGKATLAGLDLNSEVKIQVKDVLNYEDFEETVKITKITTSFTIELKKKAPVDSSWQTKTIRFKDNETKALIIEFMRVSLSCSKSNSALEVSGESSLTNLRVTGGTLDLKVKPADCGDILISVQPTSYDAIENQVLSGNTVFLTKQGVESKTGTIHVKLFDESGSLIPNLMKFSLFELGDKLNPVQEFDNVSVYSGLKSLNEISPGTYFIKTFDPALVPKYSCHNPSEEKELLAEEEITFEVTCYLVGEGDLISIQVKDKNLGTELLSDIELRKKADDSFEFVGIKKAVSNAVFAVPDDNSGYIVLVSSPNYLPYTGEKILSKGDSLTVELVKAIDRTAGKARIKVFDSEGNTASSGNVYLRYSEGPLKDLRTPYSSSIGFKGEAVLEKVKPGMYYAEALTNIQKGFSTINEVDANTITDFTVNMEKTRGLIELKITKLDSAVEIKDFQVVFFEALTGKEVLQTEFVFNSKNNTYSFDAGDYYAIISKKDYHSTKSKNFSVIANSKTIVNIALPKISAKEASIDFLGVYKENGLKASVLELNKEYSADFMLAFKPEAKLFYLDFLIGTGTEKLMQNDSIFISKFFNEFPGLAEVKKTTSFTGNYSTDFESNLTSSDAKAVLVSFNEFDSNKFQASAFVVSVKFKLKNSISDASNLVLFFKALSVGNSIESPEYYLDPLDSREFTSLESYVYAKPKTQMLSLCESDFCYSYSVSLADNNVDCDLIRYGSVSSVKIDCPYSFHSFVLNNDRNFSNLTFSLENTSLSDESLDAVEFNNYTIKTKTVNKTGNAQSSNKIEESFALNLKELIYADTGFIPVKLVKNLGGRIPAIKVNLKSTSQTDKNYFELRIRSDTTLNLFIDPKEIKPFNERVMIVDVLDGLGTPLEYASVKIEITDSVSGEKTILGPKDSDEFGEVYFEGQTKIPGLYPKSKIEVIAEFEDAVASRTIIVNDANTFSFSPKELFYGFFNSEKTIKSNDITFFDLSDGIAEQKITDYFVEFASNAQFFDENYLQGYSGRHFTKEGIITKFNLSLDTEETMDLNSFVSVDANLALKIAIGNYFFLQEIPFSAAVNSFSDYLGAFFPPTGKEVSNENKVLNAIFSSDTSSVSKFALKRKKINPSTIKVDEAKLNSDSIYLDKALMQQLLDQFKGKEIPVGGGLEIDFTVLLSKAGKSISEKQIAEGEIIFTIEIDSVKGFLVVPFRTGIFSSKEGVLTVSPAELDYTFVKGETTTLTKTLNLKSDVIPIKVNKIFFDLRQDYLVLPSIQAPFLVDSNGTNISLNLSLNSAGKTLQTSRTETGSLIIEYSIGEKNLIQEVPVNVLISTKPLVILPEGLDLSYCLGEGSLNNSIGSFWIGCHIPIQDTGERKTGDLYEPIECSNKKPKIKLSWKFGDFPVDDKNVGPCTVVTDSEDYFYCDAAQFSMELVNRIIKFKDPYSDKEGTLEFKAALISDNYSRQFFEAFDYWAMNENGLDTPTYYTQTNNQDNYNIIRKYFAESNAIQFNSGRIIEQPGLYDVKVDVSVDNLEITFTLIKTSAQLEAEHDRVDSVFYYIPFDGFLGGSKFNRYTYGSSFDVKSSNGKFIVNDSSSDSYTISSSQALGGFVNPLIITEFKDFNSMNKTKFKGTLMEVSVDSSAKTATMNFYPSYATPLILKADLNKTGNSSIYYSVTDREGKKYAVSSGHLIEWVGIGNNCTDFSGNDVDDIFFIDSKANSTDMADYANVFKLSWNASKTGTTFFRSVVYSPATVSLNYLNLIPYTGTGFTLTLHSIAGTPSDSSAVPNWMGLNGTGVNYNNYDSSYPYANSLDKVFKLIDSGDACMKTEGNKTYILWNEQTMFDELGRIEPGLRIPNNCIK